MCLCRCWVQINKLPWLQTPCCLPRCKVKVKVLSIAEGEGTDALRVDLCVMCVYSYRRGKAHKISILSCEIAAFLQIVFYSVSGLFCFVLNIRYAGAHV